MSELKRFYECHKHGVQVGEHCPMCVVHAYLPTPSQYTVPRAVAVELLRALEYLIRTRCVECLHTTPQCNTCARCKADAAIANAKGAGLE